MLCFFCFRHTRRKARLPPNPPNPKKRGWVGWEMLHWRYRLLAGFYLGFIVWGRSTPEWPKATSFLAGFGGIPIRNVFEMNMPCDVIWCILRHNFDGEMLQCVHWPRRVWWFFRYSYLCTVMITIFLWGGGGGGFFWGGGWGKLVHLKYPSIKW